MRLTAEERVVAAKILNAMLKAGADVQAQMLHPRNGQFDSNPGESARSFVRAFAAKHKISGVPYDPKMYG